MESDISQVVCGNDPGVLVGSDAPVLSHTGRIRISNVASVKVREHVENTEAVSFSSWTKMSMEIGMRSYRGIKFQSSFWNALVFSASEY